VQAVDDLLAKVQAALRSSGQEKNTYVMFSSDNGFHLGQHRLAAGKQTAFDTDVHVPFVATGPGVPSGRTVSAPAENIDLCPTFTALGGAKPTGADGHSLAGPIKGQTPGADWRDAALVEHHGPNTAKDDPDHQNKASGNPPTYAALRTTTATYVEYADGDREYYDRRTDPYELNNSYHSLSSARRDQLHTTLGRLRDCHGDAACTKAAQLH
jgi:arylsulfatase A-like enzyme